MAEHQHLERRSNHALRNNPNMFNYPLRADIDIDTRGSDWYWAVCAVMAFTTIVIIIASFFRHRSHRVFHYITAAITLTAAISYFTMASNLGYAAIQVEFFRSNGSVAGLTRSIFYVRYIDWFITTPVSLQTPPNYVFLLANDYKLLLLDIMLTAGCPWTIIAATIFLDWVMIITGLVGALTASSYKWGYFAFAMIALFGIAWNVLWTAREYARRLGSTVLHTFLVCGCWTLALWFVYPIAWGLCEGGNVVGANSEGIFYGVLDLLAKVGFAALLLLGHRKIDPAILGVKLRDYDDEIPACTTPSKMGTSSAQSGVTNSTTTGATTSLPGNPATGQINQPMPRVSRAAQVYNVT